MKQLQSLKSDLNQSRIVLEQIGEDIQDGEVLLQVEKFSFTANNVTYGVAGDSIGYWKKIPITYAVTSNTISHIVGSK